MASKHTTFTRFSGVTLVGTLVAAAWSIAPAYAQQEAAEITKSMKAGQFEDAMKKADACLATKPRDAQCRFLKGIVFTEQNKADDAIVIFDRLTQDYPELPEPYNNLAVLYASKGNYEKARQSLEMAIRTHPSYATAHENLGDVYAKLASQAYDKALSLDSANATAQSKLSLIRQMIGTGPGTRPAPTATAAAATTPVAPPPVASNPPPAPPKAEPPKAVEPPKAAEAPKAAPTPTPAPPPPPVAPVAPAAAAGGDAEVVAALNAWAQAWSAQDVKGYLGAYAAAFKPPKGEGRKAWEAQRAERIQAPSSISVKVEGAKVTMSADGTAVVTFRQNYKSNITTSSSTKSLVMSKAAGRWQIVEERSGG